MVLGERRSKGNLRGSGRLSLLTASPVVLYVFLHRRRGRRNEFSKKNYEEEYPGMDGGWIQLGHFLSMGVLGHSRKFS
jgi:hypothetical protein